MVDSIDIYASSGAADVAGLLSPNLTSVLSGTLTDNLRKTYPDFSSTVPHETYMSARAELQRMVYLAALTQDDRAGSFAQDWVTLQQDYARQTITELREGVKDQRTEISDLDGILQGSDKKLARYRALTQMTWGEVNDNGLMDEAKSLKAEVAEINAYQQQREALVSAVEGVDFAVERLEMLVESGEAALHYTIQSPDAIRKALGEKKYTGPEFTPFAVTEAATPHDMFPRDPTVRIVPAKPEVSDGTIEVPYFVSQLLNARGFLLAQPIGREFVSRDVYDNSGLVDGSEGVYSLGLKGLGAHITRNQSLFGVSLVSEGGARRFRRVATANGHSVDTIVAQLLGNLNDPRERKETNRFYMDAVIDAMRDELKAYEGFTVADCMQIVGDRGFHVSQRYLSRNIGSHGGLEVKDDAFVFSEVVPTDNQVGLVQQASADFGYGRFSPHQLVEFVRDDQATYGRFIHVRVAEAVLNSHHEEFGLDVVSSDPLEYQKKKRPDEAGNDETTSLM